MTGIYIPPVLRGATFLGVEDYENHTAIVFASPDPAIVSGVVRVKMLFRGRPSYSYTVVDSDAKAYIHYEGLTGDPATDDAVEVKSF